MGVKNIHVLSINMMLNITEAWLTDEAFCQALEASGPLGQAMLVELKKAHEPLAMLKNKRAQANATLRMLVDTAGELDVVHDRNARSLHHHLRGLSEGAADETKAKAYRAIEAFLFPDGLSVVKLPFIEEGGAAVALERAVGPELRATLTATVVGEQTLNDLFEAWMAAGRALGKVVDKRSNLKASTSRDGSAVGEIDMRGARNRWIKAVRGLLWAIDMSDALEPVEERVFASLDEAIAARLRGRDSGDDVGADAGADAGDELDESEQDNNSDDDEQDLDEGEVDDEGDDVNADDEDALDEVGE